MAIFTSKADADLPILTKIYQLDSNDETEVVSFAEGEGYPENAERLRRYFYYQKKGISLANVSHEDMYGVLRAFSTMHMIDGSRFILADLCDRGAIRRGNYREIEQEAHNTPFENPSDYDPDELIPVSDLGRERETLTARIIREVIALLARMQDGYKLARCADCDGIFLPAKGKQLYCSHRCADRVSARRRKIAAKQRGETVGSIRSDYVVSSLK